jgi:hypothetical protein
MLGLEYPTPSVFIPSRATAQPVNPTRASHSALLAGTMAITAFSIAGMVLVSTRVAPTQIAIVDLIPIPPASPILLIELDVVIVSPVDVIGELLVSAQTSSNTFLAPLTQTLPILGLGMLLMHEICSHSLARSAFVNNVIETAPRTPALTSACVHLSIAWTEPPQPGHQISPGDETLLMHEIRSHSLTHSAFVNNVIETAPPTPPPTSAYVRLSIAWIERPQLGQGNGGIPHPPQSTFASHLDNQPDSAVKLLLPSRLVSRDASIANPLRQALVTSSLIYEGLCLIGQALLAEGRTNHHSRHCRR